MCNIAQAKLPTVVLIRGLPGSGKSYLSEEILKQVGSDIVVVIDPDKIDFEAEDYLEIAKGLQADGVDERLYPYRYLRANAHRAIENDKLIVWNQAFTNLYIFNRTILNLQNHALDNGKKLNFVVVEVGIDNQTAKKRIQSRADKGGHNVSSEKFKQFTDDYESFASQGHDGVVSVDGDGDAAEQAAKIIKAVNHSSYVKLVVG